MFRTFAATLSLACLTAIPSFAFDIETMSDQERDIFRAEIRDYLLQNPEVLMEAIAVLEQRREEELAGAEVAMLEDNREAIFNDGFSFVGGNPDGDVTIVEFLDYRCGSCKRAFPAVEELLATDGNIRLIVKEFPILGEASVLGSQYAIATKILFGDEAYKSVHDKLMVMRGDLNDAALARVSSELDLDHAAIANKMSADDVAEIIQANRDLGSALQIQGTPSFVMGEQFVRGFVELDQMRSMVDAIRADQG